MSLCVERIKSIMTKLSEFNQIRLFENLNYIVLLICVKLLNVSMAASGQLRTPISLLEQTQEEEEKKETDEDIRWKSVYSLVNGNKLNNTQKDQLNKLLQYAHNCSQYQEQFGAASTIGTACSDEEIEYHINWKSLLFVIFLICQSSFIFGYVTIQFASIIDNPSSHKGSVYHKSKHHHHSLLSNSALMGACIGSFAIFLYAAWTNITHSLSRRHILILSNGPIITGGFISILTVWTSSTIPCIIGGLLQGIGFGAASIMAPILIAEISPTPVRAFMTWCSQLFIAFGMLTSALMRWGTIGISNGWILVIIIGIIPSFIQILFKNYIPMVYFLLSFNTLSEMNKR